MYINHRKVSLVIHQIVSYYGTGKQYPQYCEYPNIICMDPDKKIN